MKTKIWKVIVITLTGLLIIGSGGCGQAPENFEDQYMAQAFVRCDCLELIEEYKPRFIEYLLKNGANPDKAFGDKTMLMVLSGVGQTVAEPNLANLLVENGADINLKDSAGMTALMTAAINHREQNIKDLLKAGADTSLKDSEGKTALDYVKDSKDEEIIKLLQDTE